MADLSGQCGAYDLENLSAALQLIQGSNQAYLSVSDGTRDACFLFAQGGLRVATRGVAVPRLGEWLAFQGELRPAELERYRNEPLGDTPDAEREVLGRLGVDDGRIDKSARSLMGRLILDALFWDEPRFDACGGEAPFRDGLMGEGIQTLRVGTGLKPLVEGLLSRLRSLRETMEVLDSARVSVVTVGESKARERLQAAGDSLEGRLLESLLAKPGIHGAELLERLDCGETALVSLLAALGHLGLTRADPLPPNPSRRAEAEARIGRSLALLPRRLWLASVTRAASDRPATALNESRAGWLLVDQARFREALEHFGEALSQSPDELESLHGRVHVLWKLERAEEAATETQGLARRLLDTGVPTHALQALQRANAVRDRLPLEVLQVEALVAVGDRRAARDLAGHVVNKLRSKGREAEAQALEAKVSDGTTRSGSAPTLARPRQASGGLKAAAFLGSVVALALCGAAWLSWQDLLERKAYAENVTQARSWLEGEVVLEKLEPLFPSEKISSSRTGEAIAKVREELALLRKDEETVRRLRELVAIAWRQDIEQVIRILEGGSDDAQTRALKGPIRDLRERAERHLEQARQIQRRLVPLTAQRRLEEAYALGKRLEREFANVPNVVTDFKTRVPVKIASVPTGAIVNWRGHEVGATPMMVEVSLQGDHQLRLERQGYAPAEREILFSELESPELVITLESAQ